MLLNSQLKALMHRIQRSPIKNTLPLQYTHSLNRLDTFVVPELNIAIIPTPKVANRSIKLAVAKKLNPDFRGDPHLAGWQLISKNELQDFNGYRFGFVRNPLARLYSCYKQKIVLYARTYNAPILFWRYGNTFTKEMSFDDFVIAVSKIPDWYSDIHFRSQYCFFYYRQDLLVDFLGKFENLNTDWQTINQNCHIGELPHINFSDSTNWQNAYTKKTAAIAMQRYQTDIERFDYREELELFLKTLSV